MRNKVNHQLEIIRRKYYQSHFLGCGNDCAKMWKLSNTLTNSQVKTHSYPNKLLNPINSQHTENPEKMANIFNDYFVTVGKHIVNSITPPRSNKYPVAFNGPDHSFALHETFPEKVEAVINRLLECKSARMNDIPIHILKLYKNVLISYFPISSPNLKSLHTKGYLPHKFKVCTSSSNSKRGAKRPLQQLQANITCLTHKQNI